MRIAIFVLAFAPSQAQWRVAEKSALPEHAWRVAPTCTIDLLDVDSWNENFMSKYYLKEPAILRGWISNSYKDLQKTFERSLLLERFGKHRIKVGSFHELSSEGGGQKSISLRDYLEVHFGELYLFDDAKFLASSGLTKAWKTAPVLSSVGTYDDSDTQQNTSLTLALGSDGQGIPFHWHQDSYSLLVHGRKRWAIYAPHKMTPTGYLSTESFVTWLQNRQAGHGFSPPTWECMQEPGDVLYVPEGFFHATACVGDAVGVTHLSTRTARTTAFGLYRAADDELGSKRASSKRAIKLLKQSAKLDSSNSKVLELRAQMHGQRQEFEKTLKLSQEALSLNPLSIEAHNIFLVTLQQLGHEDAYQEHVERLRQLGISFDVSDSTFNLENAYSGRTEEL